MVAAFMSAHSKTPYITLSMVAAFMSTHSKTPYITLSMDFPLVKGWYGGRRGSSWNLP